MKQIYVSLFSVNLMKKTNCQFSLVQSKAGAVIKFLIQRHNATQDEQVSLVIQQFLTDTFLLYCADQT